MHLRDTTTCGLFLLAPQLSPEQVMNGTQDTTPSRGGQGEGKGRQWRLEKKKVKETLRPENEK